MEKVFVSITEASRTNAKQSIVDATDRVDNCLKILNCTYEWTASPYPLLIVENIEDLPISKTIETVVTTTSAPALTTTITQSTKQQSHKAYLALHNSDSISNNINCQ